MTSTDLDGSDASVPAGPGSVATVDGWSRALTAMTALAGGRSEAVARFRYDVRTASGGGPTRCSPCTGSP